MRMILQDIGYGFRLMRKNPGFTAAAVATLALGIGANTAIFSMINLLALKPLAYHQPERVAFVLGWDTERQARRFNLRLADFVDLGRAARTLSEVAAYAYWSANLTGVDLPERVQAYRVTANTFSLLGVEPALGRTFSPDEGRPGGPEVAVISYGLWQRRFAGDASIVGRQVMLDGRPHTIVGIMPRRFEFPVFNFKGDLWSPYRLDPDEALADRGSSDSVVVIARVRPDVDYATAQAEIDTIMLRLETDHPQTNRRIGARLIAMQRLDDEQAGPAMLIVTVAVALVLLLACANVANLLLARGVARQKELAIRRALGAGQLRLIRQLLCESLLLALAGAAVGTLFAYWGLDALRGALPELLLETQPNVMELGIDRLTLLFTLALSVATALVFGLVPAIKAARTDMQESLKEGHSAGTAGHRTLRTALVASEVALSVMVLVAAGLLVRSFEHLQRVNPGFDPGSVQTLTMTLPQYRYGEPRQQRQFFEQAVERISKLPGVRAAGFVNVLPFSTYNRRTTFLIEGRPVPEPGRAPSADYRVVTTEYFRALDIPLVRGRGFTGWDREDGLPAAIVNQTLARTLFAGGDPIGQRLRLGGSDSREPWRTIVGVIGDVQHGQLAERPAPEVYVPLAQAPMPMMMLAVRSSGDPQALAESARKEILAIDPAQPVYHVKTLQRLVDDSLLPQASAMSMMALFGAVALLLAAVGLYGVMAYVVSQQTREIGVRMALGARPADVARLVLGRGLAIVLGGVAAGVGGALLATQLMAGVLYGVTPADPATYAAVVTLLIVVALLACYAPARRATRVDPMVALRAE